MTADDVPGTEPDPPGRRRHEVRLVLISGVLGIVAAILGAVVATNAGTIEVAFPDSGDSRGRRGSTEHVAVSPGAVRHRGPRRHGGVHHT